MIDHDATDELVRDVSEVALALFASGTVLGTLEATVTLAVTTVEGCDSASVFVVRDGQVVTAAASDSIATELDELQLAFGEGPCVDAMAVGGRIDAPELADDVRWPQFGPAAVDAGTRSALAFRLSDRALSALNLYARLPVAFGATDRAKALILATLAGRAVDVAGERAGEAIQITNLHEALRTRELIGQAQGILIERERITGDEAFNVLRRASQHLNIKIREVARTLVETGETPSSGSPSKAP